MSSRVNDFAIKLANVNGTGSSSANGLLMQAIFRMGIPVSGKNLFPSNIQGLPTWYEIRVNKDGHTARALDYDLMVTMNSQTYASDIREVRKGGYVLHDSSWPLDPAVMREDVTFLGVPLAEMCNTNFRDARERILMKNIAYAGALAAVISADLEIIERLLEENFAGKKALHASNQCALQLGYEYAKDHFDCPLPFYLEKMDANSDKILIDGNSAVALGCLYAGATVAAWYPITPSTSVMDAFTRFCGKYRRDAETGENNYCIIQAEDELAAIGMVIGASWNGARAFTSTSGPGISLMNELIGMAYYAEIPAVIVDVQRVGPSTGMPTRTQQGDILECAYASHGDTKHILLFPANPAECFEFAVCAFDLAERFQTPTFLLTDLDIGMNDWVVPRLTWDDAYMPDRGRVLTANELENLTRFQRYTGEDADNVAARTLPGVHPKGAFFTRGSGHNKFGGYTEIPDEYQEVVDRLARKHRAAAAYVPAPVFRWSEKQGTGDSGQGSGEIATDEGAIWVESKRTGDSGQGSGEIATDEGAIWVESKRTGDSGQGQEEGSANLPLRIGVVTLGGCDPAVTEALGLLAQDGIYADYMRVRGFPFDERVEAFIAGHEPCFIVEQNRDAQLRSLLALETGAPARKMRSVLVYGGFPLSARHVVEGITGLLADPSSDPYRALKEGACTDQEREVALVDE